MLEYSWLTISLLAVIANKPPPASSIHQMCPDPGSSPSLTLGSPPHPSAQLASETQPGVPVPAPLKERPAWLSSLLRAKPAFTLKSLLCCLENTAAWHTASGRCSGQTQTSPRDTRPRESPGGQWFRPEPPLQAGWAGGGTKVPPASSMDGNKRSNSSGPYPPLRPHL